MLNTKLNTESCMQKRYVWNPNTCACENNKYLESIIDDSVFTCDKIINAVARLYIEPTKGTSYLLRIKKPTCHIVNFCILL